MNSLRLVVVVAMAFSWLSGCAIDREPILQDGLGSGGQSSVPSNTGPDQPGANPSRDPAPVVREPDTPSTMPNDGNGRDMPEIGSANEQFGGASIQDDSGATTPPNGGVTALAEPGGHDNDDGMRVVAEPSLGGNVGGIGSGDVPPGGSPRGRMAMGGSSVGGSATGGAFGGGASAAGAVMGGMPTGGVANEGGAPSAGMVLGGMPNGGSPTGGAANEGGAPSAGMVFGGMPIGASPTGGASEGGSPDVGGVEGGSPDVGGANGGSPVGGVAADQSPIGGAAEEVSPATVGGAAAGGTIGCETCVEEDITLTSDGGRVISRDHFTLKSCRSASMVRDFINSPDQECTVQWALCGPEEPLSIIAIQETIDDPIIQQALIPDMNGQPRVYGRDSRPVDGPLVKLTVGARSVLIGSACGGGGPNINGAECIDPPRELGTLLERLEAAKARLLQEQACLVFGG